MEVIRSTNIVFNAKEPGRNSNENVGSKKVYRKTRSPMESKTSNISNSFPESNVKRVTPVKGSQLDGPAQDSPVQPVTNTNTAGHDESPVLKPAHGMLGPPVLDAPAAWRKRENPGDSGIELSSMLVSPSKVNPKNARFIDFSVPTSIKEKCEDKFTMGTMEDGEYPRVFSPLAKGPITQFVLEGKQALNKSPEPGNLRTMYNNSRRDGEEGTDFSINPDPVPYQPCNFMSSTIMKKVPVTRRHLDTFGSYDWMAGIAKRGMMLHTDRYQWDLAKALDGLSQRERLHAELEYMERLRGIKRRREVLPHRAQLDLLMGGKKVEFNERFQIQREIEKLKSLILPQHAKDLFHGRGFVLPEHHNSMHPRHPLDPNADLEDELSSPFSPDKYSFNPETGRVHPRNRQYPTDQYNSLPKINSKGYLLDHFRAQKGEPIAVQTPNPFHPVQIEESWTPFVTRQSTMISPVQRAGSKSPALPYSPRRYMMKPSESPDLTLYPVSQGALFSPRYGTGLGGAPQPAYMTRSKTNVTTGGLMKQSAGRSVTAMPIKKDGNVRPTVTAPPSKPASMLVKQPDIKIPVSARDPEDSDLVEPSPLVPKSTPASNKNLIIEESEPVVEERPDVQEARDQHTAQESNGRHSAGRPVLSARKAPTPNPLKAIELVRSMSQDEQARLKQTFNKLDTDKDGHIMFSQLQTQLPKQFSQSQEKYIKQVYDITSSNTFFGVDEFMTMSYLTSVVTDLTGEPLDAYSKLDFHGLHDVILIYVELFQSVDRTHRGKISLASLQEILSTALSLDFKAEPPRWNKLIDTIEISEPSLISKIEFLAHIPYFQTLGKRK